MKYLSFFIQKKMMLCPATSTRRPNGVVCWACLITSRSQCCQPTAIKDSEDSFWQKYGKWVEIVIMQQLATSDENMPLGFLKVLVGCWIEWRLFHWFALLADDLEVVLNFHIKSVEQEKELKYLQGYNTPGRLKLKGVWFLHIAWFTFMF